MLWLPSACLQYAWMLISPYSVAVSIACTCAKQGGRTRCIKCGSPQRVGRLVCLLLKATEQKSTNVYILPLLLWEFILF